MLVDMLTLNAGSPFVPSNTFNTVAPSNWDDVINYLLSNTYHKPLNLKNPANAGRPMRGATVLLDQTRVGEESFLVANTEDSDTIGPLAWLTTSAASSDTEDDSWKLADERALGIMLRNMAERMERDAEKLATSDGGGDDQTPNVADDDTGGSSISSIVIEIVNRDGAPTKGGSS
jgi:hypothetical protein